MAKELMQRTLSGLPPMIGDLEWTNNLAEIQKRLTTYISAETFEHLTVALLQLENPDQHWMQCGGSGDGGVDGLGHSPGGGVSLLQCKWQYRGNNFEFGQTLQGDENSNRFFAALNHSPDLNTSNGIEFLSASRIAELVQKHAERLPWTLSLRIGPKP